MRNVYFCNLQEKLIRFFFRNRIFSTAQSGSFGTGDKLSIQINGKDNNLSSHNSKFHLKEKMAAVRLILFVFFLFHSVCLLRPIVKLRQIITNLVKHEMALLLSVQWIKAVICQIAWVYYISSNVVALVYHGKM